MARDNIRTEIMPPRRRFLGALASATGLVAAGCATARATHGSPAREEHDKAEVTPGEDLMQEHGVLERILLVYEEAAGRLERSESLDGALLGTAAGIVRRFIEDYHEQLEEQFVFPRLESAGREVELVAVLRAQHQRGKQITDDILRLARGPGGDAKQLPPALRGFVRMFRPHAAREDTVLFPAFRGIVGRGAYRELGEQFEEKEHALLGEGGFAGAVAEVARLETVLGIADLGSFTAP